MKYPVIGVVCVLISAAAAADPDPVDLRVRLMGPSGPLSRIPMAATYGKATNIAAETDADGWATWHLDRKIGTRVQVGTSMPAHRDGELFEDYEPRVYAYLARFNTISVPSPWLVEIPASVPSVEQTIMCPRGIVLTAGPVTNPDGTRARLVTLRALNDGCTSQYEKDTGIVALNSIPADTTSVVYLEWSEPDRRQRVMRVQVPSSHADLSLGAIQVPSPLDRTAKIVLKRTGVDRHWPARAYGGPNQTGATLVASDGSFITSAFYSTPPVNQRMSRKVDVPPGTYYVIPGSLDPIDFQQILIEKLAAGVDLSGNVALPHVTIAAGETKDLESCDVDVINAIYALP